MNFLSIVLALCIAGFGFVAPAQGEDAATAAPQVPAAAATDKAQTPLLSIIFGGNEFGDFQPCPVCGNHAYGGLPRRMTFLKTFRQENRPNLVINGAFTFGQPAGGPAKKGLLAALAKAYESMNIDIGLLTPWEQATLAEAKVTPPAAWKPVSAAPVTSTFERAGKTIGVVLFPMYAKDQQTPPPEMVKAVLDAARELAPRVDLLVGVSGWGSTAEEALLATADEPFHILLGSGVPGAGLKGRVSNGTKTLWVRCYERGKALQRIDFFELPARGESMDWYLDENVRAQTEGLSTAYTDDPDTAALFRSFSK